MFVVVFVLGASAPRILKRWSRGGGGGSSSRLLGSVAGSGRGDLNEFAACIEAVARLETLLTDNISAGKFFVCAALFALCCQRPQETRDGTLLFLLLGLGALLASRGLCFFPLVLADG
jgi:hypothetical protein